MDEEGQCKNLQELNVSECEGLNDEVMRYVSEGCPALTHLNIAHTEISNRTLRLLSRCFPNLQKLSLAYCRKFTEKGLQYLSLGKGCHKITDLDLSGCTQISVQGFRDIASGCTGIKHLVINDIPTLTDSCIKSRIGDAGLRNFLVGPSSSKLRELNLTNYAQISDLALAQMGERCCSLTYLNLCNCTQLTDCGIEFITQLPNLISIDLSVTASTDEEFCQSTPNLEHLDVSYCPKLSGEILKALSAKCCRLTSLNIAGCPKMNDLAIRILSKKCHYLHFLDVSGCVYLTDKAIEYLLEGCKQLHVLKMRYCRRISKVADFRISSQVEYCEYSIEDPPIWFGYDCKGTIFHDRVRVKVLHRRRRKSLLESIENTTKN
uniref:F-box/LRR-repeat protein 13 n=1 Tax=Phascolarctos cinereus TaxID=38626 RepID=A0A6P5K4G1_PHACI|nr:F-box/LRR-repeat protein 13 [Phascolarctos cinereus]